MSGRQPIRLNTQSSSILGFGPAPKPFKERKATYYHPVSEEEFNYARYPATAPSIYPSVTSPAQCQAYLSLKTNFAPFSECDVFEVREEKNGVWMNFDDEGLQRYLDNSRKENAPPSLRVLFVYLEDSKQSSFGCKLSVQQDIASQVLDTFSVNPHFVQFLLGKPDHLAPFSTYTVNSKGNPCYEFMCQFPRWYIRHPKKQLPCSIFFSHDVATKSTTYIVAAGREEAFVNKAHKTLNDSFGLAQSIISGNASNDCFLLSSILTRESLLDAEGVIRKLRFRLYDQLDIVDTYALNPFDRSSLKNMTNALHDISQDCESLFASAEMLAMITRRMTYAHDRMLKNSPGMLTSRTEDSLSYLSEAIEAQKRWIRSYISRKEVAMTLVYQLVMQQDSETNTAIAKATRDDSAVMKVIAIVTMIFLPPTVVTSFFGMGFFNTTDSGNDVVSKRWWIFWAVAVPLTCMVMGVSYAWWKWFEIRGWLARTTTLKASAIVEDVEKGGDSSVSPAEVLQQTQQITPLEKVASPMSMSTLDSKVTYETVTILPKS